MTISYYYFIASDKSDIILRGRTGLNFTSKSSVLEWKNTDRLSKDMSVDRSSYEKCKITFSINAVLFLLPDDDF